MPEITISYLAVILAAAANMLVGMLWYGPLFGKPWMAMTGLSKDSMKNMKMTPLKSMLGGLLAALIMAYVLSFDAFVWNRFFGTAVTPTVFAVQLAFWIWLGYIATTQVGSVLWEGKSWKLFALNAGHSLVSLLAMSLVITFVK